MWKGLRGWYELNGKRTALNVLLLLGVLAFIDPIKGLLEALPFHLLQIKPTIWADTATLLACVILLVWGLRFDIRSWGKFLNRWIVGIGILLIYWKRFRNENDLQHTETLLLKVFTVLEFFYFYVFNTLSGIFSFCSGRSFSTFFLTITQGYKPFTGDIYYLDFIICTVCFSWSLIPVIGLAGRLTWSSFKYSLENAKEKKKKSEKLLLVWKILLWIDKQLNPDSKTLDGAFTPFKEDIATENEDQLQRTAYANTLAEKIIATTPKRAFNIGIFGEWGSGKSDFMHRIGKELRLKKNEEVIIVEFNPWRVGSNSSITEDYLQVLSRHLRPYSSRLSNSIGDYAKQFIDKADTTGLVKSASNILTDTFMPNADIESQYEAIKNEVSYLKTTIVVFIDDLDRLNKEEILETFKLIRNVADFPNTFFVLGLDYDYVMKTAFGVERKIISDKDVEIQQSQTINFQFVDRNNISYQTNYLEKIFQTTLALPSLPKELVSRIGLNGALAEFKALGDTYELNSNVLENVFEELLNLNPEYINMRKFKIVNNNFSLKLKYFKNLSIEYFELYILTLLEVLHYPTYKLICDKIIILNADALKEVEKLDVIYYMYTDFKKSQELELQNRFKKQNSYQLFWIVKKYIIESKSSNSISFRNDRNFLVYTSFNQFGKLIPSEIEKLLSEEINESLISKLNTDFSAGGLNRYFFSREFEQLLIEEKFNYIGFKTEEIFIKSVKILFYLDSTDWEIRNFLNSYLDYLFKTNLMFNETEFYSFIIKLRRVFLTDYELKINKVLANVFIHVDPKVETFVNANSNFNDLFKELIEYFINLGDLELILHYSKYYYFYNAIVNNVRISELFLGYFSDISKLVSLCLVILEFYHTGSAWGTIFNDRVHYISSLLGGLESFKLVVKSKMNDNPYLRALNNALQYVDYVDSKTDIFNLIPEEVIEKLRAFKQ